MELAGTANTAAGFRDATLEKKTENILWTPRVLIYLRIDIITHCSLLYHRYQMFMWQHNKTQHMIGSKTSTVSSIHIHLRITHSATHPWVSINDLQFSSRYLLLCSLVLNMLVTSYPFLLVWNMEHVANCCRNHFLTVFIYIPNQPNWPAQLIECQPCKPRPKFQSKTRGTIWVLGIYIYIYLFFLGDSKNRGTPKLTILIGLSIINHPFWAHCRQILWSGCIHKPTFTTCFADSLRFYTYNGVSQIEEPKRIVCFPYFV